MNVYLAARYSRHPELQGYAKQLEEAGHQVTSRWIWGEHQALDADLMEDVELARSFAEEDIEDIMQSDLLIAFSESPREAHTRGGRHVETGMALAFAISDPDIMGVWVVGPVENIFMTLDEVTRFDTWEEALECL